MLEELESLADEPGDFVFRSYRDGQVLHRLSLPSISIEKYSLPYLHVHRADYHAVLAKEVRRLGGRIQLSSQVTGIDFEIPAVLVHGQSDILADVVIAADGLKSVCRGYLCGRIDPPRLSGDMAYRCTISADRFRDQDLKQFLDSHDLHYWIGPGQHIVCYKLRDGDVFNIVIACTDTIVESMDVTSVGPEELQRTVKNWDPKLQKLIELAGSGQKGRLMRVEQLDSWTHSSGNFALLGDACHSMLPYL